MDDMTVGNLCSLSNGVWDSPEQYEMAHSSGSSSCPPATHPHHSRLVSIHLWAWVPWYTRGGCTTDSLWGLTVQTPPGSNFSFRLNSMRLWRRHSSPKPAAVSLRRAAQSGERVGGLPWHWPSGIHRAIGTATRLPAPSGQPSGGGSSGPDRSHTRSHLHRQWRRWVKKTGDFIQRKPAAWILLAIMKYEAAWKGRTRYPSDLLCPLECVIILARQTRQLWSAGETTWRQKTCWLTKKWTEEENWRERLVGPIANQAFSAPVWAPAQLHLTASPHLLPPELPTHPSPMQLPLLPICPAICPPCSRLLAQPRHHSCLFIHSSCRSTCLPTYLCTYMSYPPLTQNVSQGSKWRPTKEKCDQWGIPAGFE